MLSNFHLPIVQYLGGYIALAVQMFSWNFSHLTDHSQIVDNYRMEFITITQRHCEFHFYFATGIQAIGSTIIHFATAIDIGQIGGDLWVKVSQRLSIITGYASLENNLYKCIAKIRNKSRNLSP